MNIDLSTRPVALQYFDEWIFSDFKAQRRARSHSYVTRVGTQKAGKSRRQNMRKQLVGYLYSLGCYVFIAQTLQAS